MASSNMAWDEVEHARELDRLIVAERKTTRTQNKTIEQLVRDEINTCIASHCKDEVDNALWDVISDLCKAEVNADAALNARVRAAVQKQLKELGAYEPKKE